MTSTSYAELTSWKDPKMSIITLIKFNVIFVMLYFFNFGFVTLVLYLTLFGIAFGGVATYCATLGLGDLEKYFQSEELIENIADSCKNAFVDFAKKSVAVHYWKDYRTTLKVALAAYFLLYVSDYLCVLVVLMLKCNFDFAWGAKKTTIEAVVCPQTEKVKELINKLWGQIPRAAAVKKAD